MRSSRDRDLLSTPINVKQPLAPRDGATRAESSLFAPKSVQVCVSLTN